jgi:hypothetical protein
MSGRRISVVLAVGVCLLLSVSASSQTQTSGRIAGNVTDAQGAVIVAAEVSLENAATADHYSTKTDSAGNYSILQLPPATYDVSISATGFRSSLIRAVTVGAAETTSLNGILQVAQASVEVIVTDAASPVRGDSPEISFSIDSRSVEALPLPTRNFLQLLTLASGVSAPLTNNNMIGRNSPNVSVNGARVTQNSYQINGIDAGDASLHVFADVAVPAPESIAEINVQTSLYNASVAGGAGSVQVITKTGSNTVHGGAYEYFRNEAVDANDRNLKAANKARPEMRRNVYGAKLGGPLKKERAFFFVSYEGVHEANGDTDQSLYKNVFITPGLTDDRSAVTLMKTFAVPAIDSISLNLLNFKLRNGQFLIPTPQSADGLVTGTALSTYHEEQFNANLDYRMSTTDSLTAKFFNADAPLFSALSGSNFGMPSTLPGFGTLLNVDNRVLAVQEVHTFNPTTVNEGRFGYSFLRHDEVPQESLDDSSIGIQRSNAGQYPGLPLILLARDQGGASIGTSDITYRGNICALTFSDVLTLQRGKHNIRFGGESRHSEWHARAAIFSYGEVDFPTFQDFLIGNTGVSQFGGTFGFAHLGTGITDRDAISTDYHLFFQDDWKVSSHLTLNLGLRYELDPPPYDSRGRIGGFDRVLYRPRMQVDSDDDPVGPPAAGIIEAGNAPPQYSLTGVTRVGNRLVKSIDPNNFGPRIGLAWSPLHSGRLSLRSGYGIFYLPPSFFYLGLEYFAPPFFLVTDTSGQPFANPFATAPPDSSFPLIQPGNPITAVVIDRNARTPYTQQFNASVQYELIPNTTLQLAYVGSRGVKLFRAMDVNQSQIASLDHPLTNAVSGQLIIDNSIENAPLRAPLQGVSTAGFALNESSALSAYHSLQASLNRRLSGNVQFSVAYTFSKSIDDSSNPGGGANSDGTVDRSGGLDTANAWGNQLDPRVNRGVSDFDRTHYFALGGTWDMPQPSFVQDFTAVGRIFSHWQLAGVVTAMSGLPIDIFDPTGGLLYGLFGARPNWAPGATRRTAKLNVPAGYYFNPFAFTQALVQPGQPIPSAHDSTAVVDPNSEAATDFGNVGRNILRGPSQSNVDLSLNRRFSITESKVLEFRADVFNTFNHANRDNPLSDITNSNFGRLLSFSSSPRILQFALSLSF